MGQRHTPLMSKVRHHVLIRHVSNNFFLSFGLRLTNNHLLFSFHPVKSHEPYSSNKEKLIRGSRFEVQTVKLSLNVYKVTIKTPLDLYTAIQGIFIEYVDAGLGQSLNLQIR